ncbi:hypothetical protein BCR34DRAFT_587315 [Clohesyomyces aquaticus]|uniref:Uncharacterized protein n=1 Tax=Clohesyomyces aquaticus TaxID=1231657 RepID=A0A1Y1ZQ36_9PLEO|nr:hypothetical protein BCR34DRAFT_587315 [Clohesyomyces aquaticus]
MPPLNPSKAHTTVSRSSITQTRTWAAPVGQAWETLSDARKREKHDSDLDADDTLRGHGISPKHISAKRRAPRGQGPKEQNPWTQKQVRKTGDECEEDNKWEDHEFQEECDC